MDVRFRRPKFGWKSHYITMKGVNEQQQQWLELKYTGHLGGVPPMGVGHVQEKRGGDPRN